jgi:hypothetical protein
MIGSLVEAWLGGDEAFLAWKSMFSAPFYTLEWW